ncbi:MAG TPA: hypothetical protein VM901_09890 [Bdellovibrionota bacterium]|jgi:hypothetical protein|nr:hypothetical protein [Bdellovibrionota bacterium]
MNENKNLSRPGDASSYSDVFFISCDRHDKDRIEVQFGFDGLVDSTEKFFNFDIDFVVFSPKTLGLLESQSVESIRAEFQSYFRLHSYVSNPDSEFSVDRVLERLEVLKEDFDVRYLRLFAVELDGYLKGQKRKVKNHLMLYKKKAFSTEGALADLEEVRQVISRFREIPQSFRAKDEEHAQKFLADFELLNEYASHLYVQFLAMTDAQLKEFDVSHPIKHKAQSLGVEEAAFRAQKSLLLGDMDSSWHHNRKEDLYLRRISSLKKYFHRALFIQVTSNSLERKLFVPVYGMSAALAAAWTIMVQLYATRNMIDGVEISTLAVISVGILAYVAKDIMKDFFRRYFYQSGRRWVPDFERKLFAKTYKKPKYIGMIREYLRFLDTSELRKEIVEQRYAVEGGEVERALGEDIVHFKKKVSLDLTNMDYDDQFPWGLREILRMRLDHLTVSMEDAHKRLPVLYSSGQLEERMGRRLYHIYVVAQIRARGKGAQDFAASVKAYRVTLDKNGVIQTTQIPWTSLIHTPADS